MLLPPSLGMLDEIRDWTTGRESAWSDRPGRAAGWASWADQLGRAAGWATWPGRLAESAGRPAAISSNTLKKYTTEEILAKGRICLILLTVQNKMTSRHLGDSLCKLRPASN